ncbi:Ger(x)C family spore germination protein [Cohnella endophytica]|uniref:Ger(X)C family spore germination protein n=1 Tax=Cohnella endophytica TaxID=2419778 RepID=A0A494Y3P5_9BACL|nr:Ger(x)C family spore germination protein [Cohnella endophytica]RKP57367.1 Ger(x)C family spore germination protein [Cohnella endophytica]
MRKSLSMLGLIVGWLLVSGCDNDMKNIEKLSYANAVGVDFKDGKYYGYIQMADFQNVAKTSTGTRGPSKIWIGEGSGDTFEEALFQVYETAQERIIWGHVSALVISESAMKEGIISIYESFSRYHEFRLTPWVYATRGSVKDIFSVTGFFERSPLDTMLHEPEAIHSQSSFVSPIKLHEVIRQINEPGFTLCIPSLAANKTQWSEKEKPELKLKINGAIFLKNDSFKSFIPLEELSGLRWVQSGIVRAGIPVPDPKDPSVQIVIDNPKSKVKTISRGDRPQFDIKVKATGSVVSRTKNDLLDYRQLTDATAKAIEDEIRKVFRTGIDHKTDILNLEYQLFRYHYGLWKSMSPAEDRLLTDDAIHDIRIKLNIVHTSSEKNKKNIGAE